MKRESVVIASALFMACMFVGCGESTANEPGTEKEVIAEVVEEDVSAIQSSKWTQFDETPDEKADVTDTTIANDEIAQMLKEKDNKKKEILKNTIEEENAEVAEANGKSNNNSNGKEETISNEDKKLENNTPEAKEEAPVVEEPQNTPVEENGVIDGMIGCEEVEWVEPPRYDENGVDTNLYGLSSLDFVSAANGCKWIYHYTGYGVPSMDVEVIKPHEFVVDPGMYGYHVGTIDGHDYTADIAHCARCHQEAHLNKVFDDPTFVP